MVGMSCVALAACSPTHGLKPIPSVSGPYRLGSGDQIRVLTYNDPQLSNTFMVSDAGTIDFPLLGTVRASGQTPQGFASALGHQLGSRGLLHQPSVSVEVAQYRPVFVLGEVQRAGQYNYLPGMTMETVVALAGGYTYRAIKNTASVVRTEGVAEGKAIQGKITPATSLAPGDVVTIYERYF
ncbi:polysaccharide export protein [Acetobacter sp. LMG 1627]|uniref:Polysaccharide export protein n=2 Tax=Acetobacter conturbans TaxID=1737472 RepID=A0ABX0JZR4_9PROT|nr:polysaccharide export protein [Acetobacter conturbans]